MRACSAAASAAEPETSRRAPRRPAAIAGSACGGVGEAVVHRRDGEQHRRVGGERGGDRGRVERPEVAHLAAAAQRAERRDHEPVDVKQRQRVHEHVARASSPTRRRARRGSRRSRRRRARPPSAARSCRSCRRSGAPAAPARAAPAGAARRAAAPARSSEGPRAGRARGGRAARSGAVSRQDVRELAGTRLRVQRDDVQPGAAARRPGRPRSRLARSPTARRGPPAGRRLRSSAAAAASCGVARARRRGRRPPAASRRILERGQQRHRRHAIATVYDPARAPPPRPRSDHMCHDLDSSPPIPAIAGAAVSHEDVVLETRRRQPPRRVRRDAAGALERRRRDPARRARPLPLLRGARAALRRARLRRRSRSTTSGAPRASPSATTTSPSWSTSTQTTPAGVQRDVAAAAAYLRSPAGRLAHARSSPSGFCFGGRNSWLAAAGGHDLAGRDRLLRDARRAQRPARGRSTRASEISAPILALQAGADAHITAADNAAFDAALSAAGVEHEVVTVRRARRTASSTACTRSSRQQSDDAWRRDARVHRRPQLRSARAAGGRGRRAQPVSQDSAQAAPQAARRRSAVQTDDRTRMEPR